MLQLLSPKKYDKIYMRIGGLSMQIIALIKYIIINLISLAIPVFVIWGVLYVLGYCNMPKFLYRTNKNNNDEEEKNKAE